MNGAASTNAASARAKSSPGLIAAYHDPPNGSGPITGQSTDEESSTPGLRTTSSRTSIKHTCHCGFGAPQGARIAVLLSPRPLRGGRAVVVGAVVAGAVATHHGAEDRESQLG